jgi:hypothetical protein
MMADPSSEPREWKSAFGYQSNPPESVSEKLIGASPLARGAVLRA